jgi:VWFA-related protein
MRALAFSVLGMAAAVSAQEIPPPAQAIGAGADRVSVDLVVRDKKGRPLHDLVAGEVEVYEDGVRQQIETFQLVRRPAARAASSAGEGGDTAAAAGGRPDAGSEGEPALVALVFDRLGPVARADARRAAEAYVGRAREAGRRVGIFAIDPGLSVLAPFTDDPELLAAALGRAGSLAPPAGSTAASRQRLRDLSDWLSELNGNAEGIGQAHVASAESAGNPVRGAAGRLSQRARAREIAVQEMTIRMLTAYESLDRDQQGRATASSLLALVNGLGELPGRKAVVLLSEGLTVPPNVEGAFLSVIAAANRAHVSVYAIDAAGVRVQSAAAEASREIESLRTRERAGSWMRMLEQNEDTLRLDPGAGLGRLAQETGGRLVQRGNDLAAGLAEVDADLDSYYLLSYAPRNELYDGRFRRITVKVKRPHGRLQARAGYLAVRQSLPSAPLEYEGPVLAHLDGGPLPDTIPLKLRALHSPDEHPLSTVSVVVEVPSAEFEVLASPRGNTWSQDFAIVALVRDASRRVVAKLSQRYARTRPEAEAARHGLVHFYRESRLPPGQYTIEAVALDAHSGAAGGGRMALEVPAVAPGFLRAGSLVVVRSAEPLSEQEKANPRALHHDGTLVFPNLGEAVARRQGQPLPFVLTAWPAADTRPSEATVELTRGPGPPVAQSTLALPEPDASGRLNIMGGLPLDDLDAGPYVLRVSIDDGRERVTRSAAFVLAP